MSEYEPYANPEDALLVKDVKAEAARRQEIEDFKWVLSEERGRRFIDRLVGMCGVYAPTFCEGQREGRRMFGVELLSEIEQIAPDRCLQMLTERLKRIEERKNG